MPSEEEINRQKIIGLGEDSFQKSYYPELQKHINKLAESKKLIQKSNKELLSTHKKLEESENRFRSIFEKSTDPVLILEETKITDCNNAAVKIFGLKKKSSLIGMSPTDFSPKTQPDGKTSISKARKLLGSTFNKGFQKFEWQHIAKDGTIFPVEVMLTAISKKKKILHAVLRDIKERKEMESMLLQAHMELEKKVDERTIELKQANEELKYLDTKKDQFISIAAHELKTPLTTIKGYTELLMISDLSDKKLIKKYLGMINKNSDRLTNLIFDLIDSTRISLGKLKIDCKPEDVKDIFNTIKDDFELIIKNAKLKSDFKLVNTGNVFCDKERVLQVLRNLIANAINHTKKGKISLKIEKENHHFIFSVNDTGTGIPKDEQRNIFDRFYQIEKQDRAAKGSGMGLSIAKGLVELMDGEIWVESTYGKGSTFFFKIPSEK